MKVRDLSRYNRLGWAWGWDSDPQLEVEGQAPSLQVWQHATGAILFSKLSPGEEHRLEVTVNGTLLVIEWETESGTYEQTVELPFEPDAKAVRVDVEEQAVHILVPRALSHMRPRLSIQPVPRRNLNAAA